MKTRSSYIWSLCLGLHIPPKKDGLVANSQKPRKQRKPRATKAAEATEATKATKAKSHKSHGSHKSHESQKPPETNTIPKKEPKKDKWSSFLRRAGMWTDRASRIVQVLFPLNSMQEIIKKVWAYVRILQQKHFMSDFPSSH